MDTFDYITVLVAVVVGLIIGDLALSLHRLLRDRRRVRWNWVSPLAALVILIELFNFWWQWRGFAGSTVGDVAPYFISLIVLFLIAAVTLPDEVPEEGIDLGAYFDANRSYFWTLYGLYILTLAPLIIMRKIEAGLPTAQIVQVHVVDAVQILVFFGMTRVKPRWISGAILLLALAWFVWGWGWLSRPLVLGY
jgi:hypothetical protein